MSRKFDYTAQIENYLEGNMSGDEMKAFEASLQTDPALKAEFQLQQDIVNSLKAYRKAELKSRLDQVNVGSYSGNLTGLKIAFTAAITAAVGLGVYYIATQEPDNTTSEIQLEEKIEISPLQIESAPENAPTKTNAEHIIPLEEVEKIEETAKAPSETLEAKKPEEAKVAEKSPSKTEKTVEVVKPKVIEHFEDEHPEESNTTLEAPKNKLEESVVADGLSTVEIESKGDHTNSFHYKFYNNKLYLYGDFKNIPYEIIEFNTVSGKSLYLYYQGSYYYLELNQMEMTPLPKINEEKLIEELDSLRIKK